MATPKPPLWIPELRLMECRLHLGIAQHNDGPDAGTTDNLVHILWEPHPGDAC